MKPNRLKRSLQQQRGMTLVEVVVVIAVAGILAAATAPSVFGAIQRERRRQVANDVANVFREARNQAMSRSEAYVIRFEDSDQRLDVMRAKTRGGEPVRSCRQISLNNAFGGSDVLKSYDIGHRASANMKVFAKSTFVGSGLCFEPDGRVAGVFFGSINPPASPTSCEGETFVMYLADADKTLSEVQANMGCDNKASDYELVGGHVILISSNGQIGLRPPKNG